MTFSGNPGETYSVSQLMAISLGILKAIRMTSKKQDTSFKKALNEFEHTVKDMLNETTDTTDPHANMDQSVIEYQKIIEQIDAVKDNLLEGETL